MNDICSAHQCHNPDCQCRQIGYEEGQDSMRDEIEELKQELKNMTEKARWSHL